MTDRRSHFANARVAHPSSGITNGIVVVDAIKHRCSQPVADVCATADGARDTQLRFGECFEVLETHQGWCFGRVAHDGYVGYARETDLAPYLSPTHRITARATHYYPAPDMKTKEIANLPMGAQLVVDGQENGFARLQSGAYIPAQHICPISEHQPDFVAVAERLVGTPYLWGGSTSFGIDCSGLVQIGLAMCGTAFPRDSDMQAEMGHSVTEDGELLRGDLVFWKGHVGIMLDAERLIHANAFHMAVAIEPFLEAKARIGAKEFGEILDIRRLSH